MNIKSFKKVTNKEKINYKFKYNDEEDDCEVIFEKREGRWVMDTATNKEKNFDEQELKEIIKIIKELNTKKKKK